MATFLKRVFPASKTTSEAVPNATYVLEYLYCILFFALLVVLIAVSSFDPADPTLFNIAATATTGALSNGISNVFGPFGATVADWFYQLFGVGAPIFCFVFLAQLLATFRLPRKQSRWLLRVFGYPQLVICYLGLLAAISPSFEIKGAVFYAGGIVGFKVFAFFESWFGHVGAIVALCFGVAASLPLCLGLRPLSFLMIAIERIPGARKRIIAAFEKSNVAIDEPLLADMGLSKTMSMQPSPISTPKQTAAMAEIKNWPEAISTTVFSKPKIEPLADLYVPPKSLIDEPENQVVSPAEFKELVAILEFHGQDAKKDLDLENMRLKQEARTLEEKMATFGVMGTVVRSQPGPVVNVHEFEPAAGIKVTKVLSLQDDLALGLRAQSVLMAPQPGKSTIGIEVPAASREVVSLRELMEANAFQNNTAPLPMVLGKLVDGSPLVADLSSMPHVLVAGSTGSGKSVGINAMLLSLMMNRTPKQLRLILVDPKMLELSNYDGIGHLLMPVVTEPQKAAGALKWAINEMERRYKAMKQLQVRNIAGYNAHVESLGGETEVEGVVYQTLPYIVVVIDELCDLMMTAPKDVEDCVQRLAQKARAAGIHLVLATQRPSVDVLTGVIKANLPCRMSYQVTSKHDSRTIIETVGAEKLLGKGDMLFLPPGTNKLVRAHGAYVGDREINAIADKLRILYPTRFDAKMMDEVEKVASDMSQKNDEKRNKIDDLETDGNEMDENTLYDRAVEFAIQSGTVSTSSLQRNFRIGYNRAARLMDKMVKEGLVGPSDVAGKPRQVLTSVNR